VKYILAPILEDIKIKYKLTQYDGAFKNENIYRQNASEEVDQAWEDLGINCKCSSYHIH
jgi:hypothetical protein